ncbi:hypothetical protein [Micrococcus sp.]|uniref:hypothetical protein n=1 Tax=Micrococcus sp. TaxID=1271 RepID=UPI0026DC3A60|nr:hypothetical protein [Micrococcus sp.]MDO4240877.1 hypothetical protein [Micrococcus sp.]
MSRPSPLTHSLTAAAAAATASNQPAVLIIPSPRWDEPPATWWVNASEHDRDHAITAAAATYGTHHHTQKEHTMARTVALIALSTAFALALAWIWFGDTRFAWTAALALTVALGAGLALAARAGRAMQDGGRQ